METGKLLWITGLSGAGKTTIGSEVYDILKSKYLNTVFIDGDIIRETLGNDLGHDIEDRKRNAVRISKMCEFLTSQNINVVCATLSLFKEIHDLNRKNIKQYYEIFIDVNIDELVKRDSKGLYAKAKKGEIKNVIGVDLPYDKPENPFMIIDNTTLDISINDKSLSIIEKVGLF
ncbi:adenylyl-sulfate kinase [Candidatus Woesearchaeota archaeon]|jgi:cytidine diphosphoramidate kinase|nr:adenylyl-sulfate kinase [Candidatus Woesearchaeota archaeon]